MDFDADAQDGGVFWGDRFEGCQNLGQQWANKLYTYIFIYIYILISILLYAYNHIYDICIYSLFMFMKVSLLPSIIHKL